MPSVLGKDGIGPQVSLKPTEMGTFTISSSDNEVFSFQIQRNFGATGSMLPGHPFLSREERQCPFGLRVGTVLRSQSRKKQAELSLVFLTSVLTADLNVHTEAGPPCRDQTGVRSMGK